MHHTKRKQIPKPNQQKRRLRETKPSIIIHRKPQSNQQHKRMPMLCIPQILRILPNRDKDTILSPTGKNG
jgi:hypothetical protein